MNKKDLNNNTKYFLCIIVACQFLAIFHTLLKINTFFVNVFIIASIAINVFGFYNIYTTLDHTPVAKGIISVANENGYNSVFLYDMPTTARQIRVLDLEKECISISCDEGKLTPELGDYYSYNGDNFCFSGKTMLVINANDIETFTNTYRNDFVQFWIAPTGLAFYECGSNPFDYFAGQEDIAHEIGA